MSHNPYPHLVILEHPVDKFRFRYKSEMHGTHGSLTGSRSVKPNKTYPEVELKNFNKSGIIRCSLYQTIMNTTQPSLHSHLLVVHKEDKDVSDPHDVGVSPESGYIVRFENMGIIHTAKKDVAKELLRKKIQKLKFDSQCIDVPYQQMKLLREETEREAKLINLNQVCLCFEAFEMDDNGKFKKICDPVFSNPINNLKSAQTGELKICRLSIYTGSVEGYDDLILLVEKVSKSNIKVRFFELQNEEEVWEAYGSFTEADVHHQYAIVLRTPPYRDKDIDNHVNVFVELVRESDNKRSAAVPFRYKPKNIVMARKRRRISNSSKTSSTNSFEMPESMPHQVHKLKLEPRQTSISEESSSGVYDDYPSNEPISELNIFMQQVDVDFEELKDLLQESLFSGTGFGLFEDALEVDSEEHGRIKGRRPKQLTLHPALKLILSTFNDRSKCGFQNTITRIENIFHIYTAQNDNADTIVHDICKQSNYRVAEAIFKIFSKLKLTHFLHQRNNNHQTPLHIACLYDQPVYIRPLIAYKCDPNLPDINGNTALHIVVTDNLLQCLEGLVVNISSSKLDANLLNNDGMTPLHLAIRKNNVDVLKILLLKCNSSVKLTNKRDGNNALHLAIQKQNTDMISIILENSDASNLKIPNQADHTAVDLAKALKEPKRTEILNLLGYYLPTAIVDDGDNDDDDDDDDDDGEKPDLDESSNYSSAEDDDNMSWNTTVISAISEEEEILIREKVQADSGLCKSLAKHLAVDDKWKKFVKQLKLDHLLCIWPNAEAMLKCVVGVEHIKILNVLEALQAVNTEAANVLTSFVMKHLDRV